MEMGKCSGADKFYHAWESNFWALRANECSNSEGGGSTGPEIHNSQC